MRVLDIPNSIPKHPKSAQNRVKIAQNRSWELFWSDFYPANVPKSVQERPKGVQERPKSVSGAPKSAPRATQERYVVFMWVVSGLQVVASGGSPAALGGRWRGGGEVNFSVNDHQAVFIQHLAALRRGAGGFRTLKHNCRSTLKGVHAFGLLRMSSGISPGSRIVLARNSYRFCKEVTSRSPPGGLKSIRADENSISDRLGTHRRCPKAEKTAIFQLLLWK